MNPNVLGISEPATGEFKPDAKVQLALANAKKKIETKAQYECGLLRSNLGLILRDFTDFHSIQTIGWVSPVDQIPPDAVLDMLCARITAQLAEQMYSRFLEQFTDSLLELDSNERRSQ
jgi:hypothetical protein